MKTVVVGPRPPEIEALIERRRALGQDRFDEVWDGDYHMNPVPHVWHGYVDAKIASLLLPYAEAANLIAITQVNIGLPGNFRAPDGAYLRTLPDAVWLPTAAIVVEVLSPDDETWEKLPFYFQHRVDEICVADPRARTVQWFVRGADAFVEADASPLLGVAVAALAAQIAWPG
ncbi:MAG TPA: Uma2 family endonuclease [Sporichthya sp.]|nr:Uma2 family endonuclease [Sporichthya sp.]